MSTSCSGSDSSGAAAQGGALPDDACFVEGEVDSCYPASATTLGVGVCHAGQRTCSAGRWTACEGWLGPAEESCNEQDDDCDGLTDESCGCEPGDELACYGGPPATRAVGLCTDGVQRCVLGTWGDECEGEVQPKEESCNGLDDNCDGMPDDADCACIDGRIQSCYGGSESTRNVGLCREGTQMCSDGHWPSSCDGDVLPTAESCNGLDDDCDGTVDDGDPGGGGSCTTSLPGICASGVRHCDDGSVVCEPLQDAVPESCNNGLDDDCDGLTDCGEDPDCDGQPAPPTPFNETSCVCWSNVNSVCNNSTSCGTCRYIGGEFYWCRKVDGSWSWRPAWVPTDPGLCPDAHCTVACCNHADFWCDSGTWSEGFPSPAECPSVPPTYSCE